MTDPITREDLEMAAKAAGLVVVGEADKMVALLGAIDRAQAPSRHQGELL